MRGNNRLATNRVEEEKRLKEKFVGNLVQYNFQYDSCGRWKQTPGALFTSDSTPIYNDWCKPVLVLGVYPIHLCHFRLHVLNSEGRHGWVNSTLENDWIIVSEINGGKEEPCPMQK